MNHPSIKQLQDWESFKEQKGPGLTTDLMESMMDSMGIHPTVLGINHIRSFFKSRKPFSHKGHFGHALLIAGNTGKMGAALLAAKSCLRSGTGLLTVAVPEGADPVFHVALPEAMIVHRDADHLLQGNYSAIGIGPGLGTSASVQSITELVLKQAKAPVVIDADALNILAEHINWLDALPSQPSQTILTPHPKEFDRLFGISSNDPERWQKAIIASKQYHVVIILKGHFTLIVSEGKIWINHNGNAGLAKGGSGDTLTGIITAFLSQGYTAENAALLGVYLHGLAADITLAENQSAESLLASDLTENLGRAFKQIDPSLM